MKRGGVRVGMGTRFLYDGEVIEIVKIHCVQGAPEVVARHVRTETVCRLALNELMFSPRSRLLSEHLVVESADVSEESASVRWSAAPESERSKARERAAHVREALTGYQSGTPISPGCVSVTTRDPSSGSSGQFGRDFCRNSRHTRDRTCSPGGWLPSRTRFSSSTNWRPCFGSGWRWSTTAAHMPGSVRLAYGRWGFLRLRCSSTESPAPVISRHRAIRAWPTTSSGWSGARSSTTASKSIDAITAVRDCRATTPGRRARTEKN